MLGSSKWSKEEDEYVIKSYPNEQISIREMANYLNRSHDAVITQVSRLRKQGSSIPKRHFGFEYHSVPVGSTNKNGCGYVMEKISKEHPLYDKFNSSINESKKGKWVYQHTKVFAEHIGHVPNSKIEEQIHHIDGDKTNNRIENLELRIGNHGTGGIPEPYDLVNTLTQKLAFYEKLYGSLPNIT